MDLSHSLRLSGHETVAFVGGGGKTTAMFRLAEELSRRGPVITTTSTRVSAAQTRLAPAHLELTPGASLPDLDRILARQPHVLITDRLGTAQEDKAPGLDMETLGVLRAAVPSSAMLVEADGSRTLSFKAPAEHEPVVPSFADVVVAVVGIDAVGCPLAEPHVHRPDVISNLSGLPIGEAITAKTIADVLANPRGGRKGVPAGARFVVLINKVESPEQLSGARDIARGLLAHAEVDSVLVGAVASNDPVREVHTRVTGIVLAAGASSRMGEFKPTLRWRGRPLIEHVVRAGLDAGLSEVVTVTGCRGETVAEALRGLPVRTVDNSDWENGQATSVTAGLRAVAAGGGAAIFLLVDQPQTSPRLVEALVERHRQTLAPIVAPRAAGRRGNPVLFDRSTWPDLLRLTGDTGGRPLFEKHAGGIEWIDWDESALMDLDTMSDYLALIGAGE